MKYEKYYKLIKEQSENFDKSQNCKIGQTWNYHLLPVIKNACLLADKYGADKDIVEIAALFHDYADLIDFDNRDNHHSLVNICKPCIDRQFLGSMGRERHSSVAIVSANGICCCGNNKRNKPYRRCQRPVIGILLYGLDTFCNYILYVGQCRNDDNCNIGCWCHYPLLPT